MNAQTFYLRLSALKNLFTEIPINPSNFHYSFYYGLDIKLKLNYSTQNNEIFSFVSNYELPVHIRDVFGQIEFTGQIIFEDELAIFADLDEDHICVNIETNQVSLNEFGTNFEMLLCAATPEHFLEVLYLLAENKANHYSNLQYKIDDNVFIKKLVDASGDKNTEQFYTFLLGE